MDNFESIIFNKRNIILHGFIDAICYSIIKTKNESLKQKPEEPDFIAIMIKYGIKEIAETIINIIKPYKISLKVSGVFCHQKPIISFNKCGQLYSCEIGDLLIAHIHKNKGKQKRMALLLQAKIAKRLPIYIETTDPQYNLYHHWPIFSYKKCCTELNGKMRNVVPKGFHLGAQYLLIENIDNSIYNQLSRCKGCCRFIDMNMGCMSISLANNPLWPSRSLAEEMLLMMMGVSGKPWNSSLPYGWSQVIRDLMYIGARSVFNRKNVGINNAKRIDDIYLSFSFNPGDSALVEDSNSSSIAGDFLRASEYGGDGFRDINEEVIDKDFGAVPIILIQTESFE